MFGIFGRYMVDENPARNKDPTIAQAFGTVERQYFCPDELKSRAQIDQPLVLGHFHHSALHIYVRAVEALELRAGLSILNIGSGSGYFSTVMAHLNGVTGVNHGIEIHQDMVEMARAKTATFRYEFQFLCGNVFDLDNEAEPMTYDRIYIGAGASVSKKSFFYRFIKPGGILVGPFGFEFLKVTKSLTGEITEEVLAEVRFAPLRESEPSSDENGRGSCLTKPKLTFTSFPPYWCPEKHPLALPSFQRATKRLLCIYARNSSSMVLPIELLWMVLAFAHRQWFEEEPSELVILQRKFEAETKARKLAEAKVTELEDEVRVLRHQVLRLYRLQHRREVSTVISTDVPMDTDLTPEVTPPVPVVEGTRPLPTATASETTSTLSSLDEPWSMVAQACLNSSRNDDSDDDDDDDDSVELTAGNL